MATDLSQPEQLSPRRKGAKEEKNTLRQLILSGLGAFAPWRESFLSLFSASDLNECAPHPMTELKPLT